MINREGNHRYIAIKYSVRGSDLGSTVEQAMQKVNHEVKLPQGYTLEWAGECESQKRGQPSPRARDSPDDSRHYAHHDDNARRQPGSFARCHLARPWIRLSAALRDRYSRRTLDGTFP